MNPPSAPTPLTPSAARLVGTLMGVAHGGSCSGAERRQMGLDLTAALEEGFVLPPAMLNLLLGSCVQLEPTPAQWADLEATQELSRVKSHTLDNLVERRQWHGVMAVARQGVPLGKDPVLTLVKPAATPLVRDTWHTLLALGALEPWLTLQRAPKACEAGSAWWMALEWRGAMSPRPAPVDRAFWREQFLALGIPFDRMHPIMANQVHPALTAEDPSFFLSHGWDWRALQAACPPIFALHRAAKLGWVKAVAALLADGADPNAHDDQGRPVLHALWDHQENENWTFGVRAPSAAVQSLFLRAGADPTALDREQRPVWHLGLEARHHREYPQLLPQALALFQPALEEYATHQGALGSAADLDHQLSDTAAVSKSRPRL